MSSDPDKKKPASMTRKDSAALWVTYINIVLYALCYQLQNPVEPFLIKSLTEQEQADSADVDADINLQKTYGNLQSFFSIIQTIGSPLVGILLDRIGIRYASAMVFLSSAASYTILASAKDMTWLFYSKIPTALQHAFLIAQATAATATGNDAAGTFYFLSNLRQNTLAKCVFSLSLFSSLVSWLFDSFKAPPLSLS